MYCRWYSGFTQSYKTLTVKDQENVPNSLQTLCSKDKDQENVPKLENAQHQRSENVVGFYSIAVTKTVDIHEDR